MAKPTANKNSIPSPAVSRDSLIWLALLQIFIVAPHFLAVPIWIPVVWVAVLYWRFKIFQGAWNYPSKLHKTLVVLGCSVGLVLTLGAHFSLTVMVSLLLIGAILKLLEIKTRKDFILLVFLCFFILATQFIFYNNMLTGFYGVMGLLLLCAALVQLYQPNPSTLWLKFRFSVILLLQAIPILVLLFVVMPRLGAFWSVPAPKQATTGLSDSMSPGDFSELIQSDELAFRVVFAGAVPAREKLYWRSLVFSSFDGRRWSPLTTQSSDLQSSSQAITGWRNTVDYRGDLTQYDIIAEPSGRTWLYSLSAPKVWSDQVQVGRDLNMQANSAITQRIKFKVTSALNYGFDVNGLSEKVSTQNLQLPRYSNPHTVKIAQEWRNQTKTTEQLIEKLFSHYRANFFYTLKPPPLSSNSIDAFLWQTHQGFCEHFSSSFVFFMRAAGIPARVVVGYQGGELNPVEKYLSIRQRDAHAWAEVWIQGRGWVVYDPTAAVAPERIRTGIAASLNTEDQRLLAQPLGHTFTFLAAIRHQWDAVNFQWLRWVMNYDSTVQTKLLTQLLDKVTPIRLVIFILSTLITCLALVLAPFLLRRWLTVKSRLEHSAQLPYRELCKKLAKCGFTPKHSETPSDFLARVSLYRSDLASALAVINNLYIQVVYADNQAKLPALKSEVSRFSAKNP